MSIDRSSGNSLRGRLISEVSGTIKVAGITGAFAEKASGKNVLTFASSCYRTAPLCRRCYPYVWGSKGREHLMCFTDFS
jgi:hypothetical protein